MKIDTQRLNFKTEILKWVVLELILAWGLIGSFGSFYLWAENSVPVYGYKVINVFPHDPQAFTQGLVFHKGFLYEGTGLLGKSTLRKVDLKTGKILKMISLPDQYFGEGITLWKDQIIQLTWKSGVGLVYDRETFRLLKKFTYFSEGWGITQDGKQLIMSDGTSFLYFLDPVSFKEVKRIQVLDHGIPIPRLNELEYINLSCPARDMTPRSQKIGSLSDTHYFQTNPSCPARDSMSAGPTGTPRGLKIGSLSDGRYGQTKGEILANVYLTDRIVRISPETGQVTGWIDLRGLLPAKDQERPVDVLNGIAYDAQKNRILVTGKYWPHLFEIRLVPR